jgi:hypothetical protein
MLAILDDVTEEDASPTRRCRNTVRRNAAHGWSRTQVPATVSLPSQFPKADIEDLEMNI